MGTIQTNLDLKHIMLKRIMDIMTKACTMVVLNNSKEDLVDLDLKAGKDSLRDLDLKAGKDSPRDLGLRVDRASPRVLDNSKDRVDLCLREDKVFLRDLVDKDKASPRVPVALVSVKAVNRDSPSKVVNKGKDFKVNRSCIQNHLEACNYGSHKIIM